MSVDMQYIVNNYDLPFEYVTLLRNENELANQYLNNNYNIWGIPTCYLDGGVDTYVGADTWQTLMSHIISAGTREVVRIGMHVSLDQIDSTLYNIQVRIEYDIENPQAPSEISGIEIGLTGHEYSFSTAATDPDSTQLWYNYDWADGTNSGWLGPYNQGQLCIAAHTWSDPGRYEIAIKARDNWFFESDAAYKTVFLDDFYHGDANGDLMINILDVNRLISFLYFGGPMPEPYAAGDCDGNVVVNILDISYLINYLYYEGAPPVYGF